VPDWDTLRPDEKKVCIRHQELFAAFAELTDYEIGRVVQAIDDMGAIDDTVIIYITGDNGATPNGPLGTFNTLRSFNQVPETLADQLDHFEEMGGPHSAMTPPLGWAIAENTPFAFSQFHTPYGGTTNGTVIPLAKGDHRQRRDPRPVPPSDRHRPDRAGASRAAATRLRRRHQAETARRGQHGLHLHRR
jgi:arylsulfatase A-like enzyme